MSALQALLEFFIYMPMLAACTSGMDNILVSGQLGRFFVPGSWRRCVRRSSQLLYPPSHQLFISSITNYHPP
ncbi:hypothetical protein R3P38DRAFT_3079917 [Favolaschia claudopus]|uniref:Secreted protein n=1 Tax=Favolaschia claudopus TaxID=2862362 RepID=A0AAV9ZVP6_9AGAR